MLLDINRQRASLILSQLFDENLDPRPLSNIPTPLEVSKRERLFVSNKILGHRFRTADIGVTSTAVFSLMRGPSSERNAALASIFSGEDHILWFQRISKKHVYVLISLSSHSLKAHFRAWAHAFVLAELVAGTSLPIGKTELHILEKEAGDVSLALKIVNAAFEQGEGIERALVSKGWNIESSMMCPHTEGKFGWRGSVTDDKVEDTVKRE